MLTPSGAWRVALWLTGSSTCFSSACWRRAQQPPAESNVANWQRLAAASELQAGECGEYIAGDRVIALFNVDGKFYALDGICPHQGGPLGKGSLNGCVVTCPWHGFQFDVTTGQHQTSRSLLHPVFPVKVEDE